MSGHSKWSTIKRRKEKVDAKKGRLFTRLIKEITIAAKQGGGDPDGNPRLRTAIATARSASMPSDNIDRAIKRGTGELPGVVYEEVTYEGYGPGGVGVLVETVTDNKNRTTSEIRRIFTRHGGNLGGVGCVSWMFEQKGVVLVEKGGLSEEELLTKVLEAGAEDVRTEDESYEIICNPPTLDTLKDALRMSNIPFSSAEVTRVPQTTVKVTGHKAEQLLRLMEEMEEFEDVQNIYANFDIPDEVIQRVAS